MELPESQDSGSPPFGPNEESAIVSLILDFPELYSSVAKFLKPELFSSTSIRYVLAAIAADYNSFGVIPSRSLIRDRLTKSLTVDDPWEDIIAVVDRQSDPREIPIIRKHLLDWVEHQVYSLLYSDEAIDAHQRGDHTYLKKIFDEATRVKHSGQAGFWLLDQFEELFIPNNCEHISMGFPTLDKKLNEGGPSPKEVLLLLAPPGVGKTLILCNIATTCVRNRLNVLFITFELSSIKTAARATGSLVGQSLSNFFAVDTTQLDNLRASTVVKTQEIVRSKLRERKAKGGDCVIYELPPDECDVNNIYAIIENLKKTKGWVPKVVIIDYMDLMLSRVSSANEDDYDRQKHVSTEIRGLAINENVFVASATQANRSAIEVMNKENGHIGTDKSAESFGKTMPVDYMISINQSETERKATTTKTARLFIAKNRNGPQFEDVAVSISYDRMTVTELTKT